MEISNIPIMSLREGRVGTKRPTARVGETPNPDSIPNRVDTAIVLPMWSRHLADNDNAKPTLAKFGVLYGNSNRDLLYSWQKKCILCIYLLNFPIENPGPLVQVAETLPTGLMST